jgi:chemotaxis response regulator CheB
VGALSAGLARKRPRSAPERVMLETHSFLRLLIAALDGASPAAVEAQVRAEARRGAFACATELEAREVIAVWEGVLRSVCAGHPELARGGHVERTFERLRAPLLAACRRATAKRVDVVAVGGSAGGIEAVGPLLAALSWRSPATLLVVIHTHPSAPAHLPLVLSRFTSLPIAYPTDGGLPMLGTAFVAPPNRHLAIEDGRLRLLDSPRVCYSRPSIDVLFATAAASFGPRLASVVLSGTGRDGAAGTVTVRARGGITLAQDPEEADFGTMPEHAIATGAVQIVGDLSVIRRKLNRTIVEGRPAAA